MAGLRNSRALSRGLLVGVLLLLALPEPAHAGELIRYRRADGSVGFAGSESSVPPGARILTRRPTSRRAADDPGEPLSDVPAVDQFVAGVRRHCEQRHGRAGDAFDYCIADQTRNAFRVRDRMLEIRSGSEAAQIMERCRRRFERGQIPDYQKLWGCTEEGRADFQQRTGQHPADLAVDRRDDASERQRQSAEHRLRQLRQDQARAERELAIGRDRWGPRYRKAEREYVTAKQETESIIRRMRDRGCRPDSLACGSLGPQLEHARRTQEKKRGYLEVELVEECRLAGCQPGWLR